MDFTEDPFKDYRYEDPFNIEDPFADVTDSKKQDPFGRPTSVAGFETDDFFSSTTNNVNGGFALEKRSGRVSAPPDPFSRAEYKPTLPTVTNNNDSWAAWPNDSWAADDAWASPTADKTDKSDAWSSSKPDDSWADKTDNWATQWTSDQNKNLNETWPSNTLPSKKEKSPKPVKYAKSLVHTIGGIGRAKHNKKEKSKVQAGLTAEPRTDIPSEEQQWAWAAAESKRLEAEAESRRRQEDAELQLALAISRQEK